MSKVIKKVINIIIDIIVVMIIIVSLFVLIISLTSQSEGIPNLFGIAPLSVVSDSMEDTLMVNDLIFCEIRNDKLYDDYEVGDIVTFNQKIDGEYQYNTHRIIEVIKDDGITLYKTQGDNSKTLVILLPMILFFVYEAVRVIMNIIAYNKEKAAEEAAEMVAHADLTEEQKQRAIAEYLAQQKAKPESEASVQTPAGGDADNAENG